MKRSFKSPNLEETSFFSSRAISRSHSLVRLQAGRRYRWGCLAQLNAWRGRGTTRYDYDHD